MMSTATKQAKQSDSARQAQSRQERGIAWVFEDLQPPPRGAIASRVDRENGVIHGVKIIGLKSRNNRIYPLAVLEAAKNLYEGARVYLDHPGAGKPISKTDATVERKLEDGFGELRNVIVCEDGLYADLHFTKSHPRAEQVCENCERFPTKLGLSHNALQRQRIQDGRIIVEAIEVVRSVDLVSDPATTQGIFESVNPDNYWQIVNQRNQGALFNPWSPRGMKGNNMSTGPGYESDPAGAVNPNAATATTNDDAANVMEQSPVAEMCSSDPLFADLAEKLCKLYSSDMDNGEKVKQFSELLASALEHKDLSGQTGSAQSGEGAADDTNDSASTDSEEESKGKAKPDRIAALQAEVRGLKQELLARNMLAEKGIGNPKPSQVRALAAVVESKAVAEELVSTWIAVKESNADPTQAQGQKKAIPVARPKSVPASSVTESAKPGANDKSASFDPADFASSLRSRSMI